MPAITLTEENFDREVQESNRPVLVSFSQNTDLSVPDYKCCKVDVRKSVGLARRYRIYSVPTVLLFRGGRVTDTIVGSVGSEQLMRILQ